MEQNNNVIITYKYYDDRKRRVAIMAKKLPLEHMEITIITCSKKDAFNKKFARNALTLLDVADTVRVMGAEFHPKRVILSHAGKFKDTFFEWCNDNYYKMREGFATYHTIEAVRGNTHLILQEVKHVQKMDKRYF